MPVIHDIEKHLVEFDRFIQLDPIAYDVVAQHMMQFDRFILIEYNGFGVVCVSGGESPVIRGQAFPTKRGV